MEYAEIPDSAGEGCRWEKLTVGEFKIWLAILIYTVWDLINAGMEESSSLKKPNTWSQVEELAQFNDKNNDHATNQYVTNNFELSLLRLSLNGHLPKWRKKRNSCV
ncbi:3015_t:CDS:2 [Dentiscutata heterogama]|uniref:3015_t:CDS:1 n=1 Tax=Dentiscutata heterogama TaxID=1316150 RepID=A0ACA9K4P7_9GLOM|nr:3015_t:CDS:2 [Dentiscutata heterogama]